MYQGGAFPLAAWLPVLWVSDSRRWVLRELTMGVSAREERQGKLCSNECRPCARPFTNAPPSQAGFEAQALCPHSQMWKLRLHQARWHSREMAEPGPGTGMCDTHVCVCGLCIPRVPSDSKQSPGWSTRETGQHPAPQTCCVGGLVSMRVGWLVHLAPPRNKDHQGCVFPVRPGGCHPPGGRDDKCPSGLTSFYGDTWLLPWP